jgi:subtilase-type serine protease
MTVNSGGTLNLGNHLITVTTLNGSGSVTGTSGGVLTVGTQAATSDSSFGGTIGDGLSLIKSGGHMLTLSGTNTYSGLTTVSGGNLCVMGIIGTVSVISGGTLSGTSTVSTANVYSGGILSPGADGGNGVGTLNTGNLDFWAGSSYYVDLTNSSPRSDKINVAGTVIINNVIGNPGYIPLSFLVLRGSQTPQEGETMTLISNDDGDAISGYFASPNGTGFSLGDAYYMVYYRYNNGNDMILLATYA